MLLDNAEWLRRSNYIEFLRDVGRHFSVNRMLAMDSVKLRLEREHELSFIEFNYMCLQAYDFVETQQAPRLRSCRWAARTNGATSSSASISAAAWACPQLYALTSPLLTTASGAKMGKTAAGAVWLNADMLSPSTIIGNIGATPRTRDVAGSSSSSPTCRSTRWRGSRRCKAPRSTRRKRCWRPRSPR